MKNNKKGFTLIELLAVIAILAILVVLAVPAILRIFNESKDSALVTQAQSIYKAAEEQIITDQMTGKTPPITYCYMVDGEASSIGSSTLELSGTTKVSYKIVVSNVSGQAVITSVIVSDGSKIINESNASGVAISDIALESIHSVNESGSTATNFPFNCN